MKQKINFSQFTEIEHQLEIKIGNITDITRINKKMLKLIVDFGNNDIRSVVTNIGNKIENLDTLKKCFPFVTNLESATISGHLSEAMIIIGTNNGEFDLTFNKTGTILL